LAKKTKAAVKKKPAKTQARAAAPAKAPKKTAAAKSTAKPAKASAAKAVKTVAAKTIAAKAPAAVAPEVKPVATPRAEAKAEVLTLPTARQAEPAAPKPAPAPAPVVRKAPEKIAAARADLPPAEGFTLLVDGHFKNQFGDLKGAKAAASELKTRFPMLRIEIYDGANKARLPA
jgi:hypothetical protein